MMWLPPGCPLDLVAQPVDHTPERRTLRFLTGTHGMPSTCGGAVFWPSPSSARTLGLLLVLRQYLGGSPESFS
eukprot:9250926-Pyramimonas_sp.AAC.1